MLLAELVGKGLQQVGAKLSKHADAAFVATGLIKVADSAMTDSMAWASSSRFEAGELLNNSDRAWAGRVSVLARFVGAQYLHRHRHRERGLFRVSLLTLATVGSTAKGIAWRAGDLETEVCSLRLTVFSKPWLLRVAGQCLLFGVAVPPSMLYLFSDGACCSSGASSTASRARSARVPVSFVAMPPWPASMRGHPGVFARRALARTRLAWGQVSPWVNRFHRSFHRMVAASHISYLPSGTRGGEADLLLMPTVVIRGRGPESHRHCLREAAVEQSHRRRRR